jgi:hypothetical protein
MGADSEKRLMGVREYARHAGVSHTAVQKAIAQGRLRDSVSLDEKGRPKIDAAAADQEWRRSTSTTHPHARHSENRNLPDGPRMPSAPSKLSPEEARAYPSYAQSRAVKEGYLAQLAKLDFDERSARLVRADDVKVRAFQVARRVRDALLNVPVRVVDEITAIAGELSAEQRHEILLIMQREIIQALEDLSDNQA